MLCRPFKIVQEKEEKGNSKNKKMVANQASGSIATQTSYARSLSKVQGMGPKVCLEKSEML